MHKLRILYCGTAEFAIKPLEALLAAENFEIVGVVTQPDSPVGRKQIITPAPLKKYLLSTKDLEIETGRLKIYQPEKLKHKSLEILEQAQPELIVVAAYGQMIPEDMLNYPKYGCINIHGSLMPEYRGAIPVQAALLNGDLKTGVSILKMTPGLDDGPVLAERSLQIAEQDTALDLFPKLSELGAELLLNTIPSWVAGEIKPTPQEVLSKKYRRELSVYRASDLSRANGQIHSSEKVRVAFNKIRAYAANGAAWILVPYKGNQVELKIHKARIYSENVRTNGWGKLTWQDKKLLLNLADGRLELEMVQLSGRNIGTGKQHEYLVEDTNANSRILVTAENEILVIKRNKGGRRYLVFPGGHLKRGEDHLQGAVRELKEETGLIAKPENLKLLYSGQSQGEIINYYQYKLDKKVPVKLGEEETERSTSENSFTLAWIHLQSPRLRKLIFAEVLNYLS